MIKRVIFVILALFVSCGITGVCFAGWSPTSLNRARDCMKAKDYEQAEAIYLSVLKEHPERFRAHTNLVILYLNQERYDKAQEYLDKLIENFSEKSTFPKAIYRIAKKYTREGMYGQAKSLFELIKQRFPDSSKVEGSQDHIRELEVLSLVQSGNYTEAQQSLDKLIEDYSGHRSLPGMLCGIAKEYQESGKYAEAKSIYSSVITDYPQTKYASGAEESLVSIYVSLEAEGRLEDSLDQLTTDYSGHSSLPAMLYIIAGRCAKQGQHETAKSIYQTIVSDHPGTESAFKVQKELALNHIISGEEEEADVILARLLTDYSSHSCLQATVTRIAEQYYIEAFQKQAQGLNSESKDYFRKAVSIWQMAIDELPTDPETMPKACSWAGDCYIRLGEYVKSIECYQKVAADYPEDHLAWNALFMVSRNYEKLKKAGLISGSEADSNIKIAYELLVERYPDCYAAKVAKRWLSRHGSK